MDHPGRLLVAWTDGCTAACVGSNLVASNTFSAKGVITRQSGGLPHSPPRPRPEPHLVLSRTLASTGLPMGMPATGLTTGVPSTGLTTGVPATDLLTDVPTTVLGLVGGAALLQRRRTT